MARAKRAKKLYRVILAMDPGASAGVALFVDGQYKGSRACGGASHKSLVVAIDILTLNSGAHDVPSDQWLCVIEDGGWDRGKGAKTLDRRRGLCMGAAEMCGFTNTVFVGPSTWQSFIFERHRPEDTKVASMAWCKKWLNIVPDTHDAADAVCIGWWALDK